MMLGSLKMTLWHLKIVLWIWKSEVSLKKDWARNLNSELYYILHDNFLLTECQDWSQNQPSGKCWEAKQSHGILQANCQCLSSLRFLNQATYAACFHIVSIAWEVQVSVKKLILGLMYKQDFQIFLLLTLLSMPLHFLPVAQLGLSSVAYHTWAN